VANEYGLVLLVPLLLRLLVPPLLSLPYGLYGEAGVAGVEGFCKGELGVSILPEFGVFSKDLEEGDEERNDIYFPFFFRTMYLFFFN